MLLRYFGDVHGTTVEDKGASFYGALLHASAQHEQLKLQNINTYMQKVACLTTKQRAIV